MFNPQTKGLANQRPRVLICDGFRTYKTLEILEFCFKNNIFLYRLPSHTSHKLQPCDVGVFAPLKTAYRDEVERLYRGGLDTIGKEHFTSLYKPARERALTKKNITAGRAATGLFPFNPDRVIRHTPEPPAGFAISEANTVVGLCPQDEVLKTPMTPVTPLTTEALTSLHNLIKQEACALNELDKQRLQRYVQKLASAAQRSFAKEALLQEQTEFLSQINKEVKARRSTKSVVLGKAKVMSYEDLEEARVKRAAKEKGNVTAVKGKHDRKHKRLASEAQPEAELDDKGSLVNLVPEPATASGAPWRAPVARMY